MEMESPNGLHLLLDWLHEDRDEAGAIYVKLLERLAFTFRLFDDPDEIANEVIDRVCQNLQDGKVDKTGKAANYIYGVARNVKREKFRRKKVFLSFDPDIKINELEPDKVDEEELEKLCNAAKDCINEAGENGKIFMKYYFGTESADKFDYRKELARENGMKIKALRVKVLRIRAKLEECVEKKIN